MKKISDIKIVLVDPSPRINMPSLGLGYIAASLIKHGVKNVVVLQKPFTYDLPQAIIDEQPDLVGYTSVSPYLSEAISVARYVADKWQGPQILGGSHITALPESLPEIFALGVVGEGEDTVCEIVNLLAKTGELPKNKLLDIDGLVYRRNGEIIKTSPRQVCDNLDDLPKPARNLLNVKGFFGGVNHKFPTKFYRSSGLLTARGCPYNCIFCQERALMKKFRSHSAKRTIEEIKELVEVYDVNLINIMDDFFLADKKKFKDVAEEVHRQGLDKKTTFFCYARADHLNDETCRLLKLMNVKLVFIGFESGSDKILKYLKNATCTVEMNQRAYDACRKYGLEVYGSFIFGSPDETIKDMKQTLDFIKKNHMTAAESQVLTPLPGSGIWQYALNNKLVSNNMDFSRLMLRKGQNNVWLNEHMSFEEFDRFFNKEVVPVNWHNTQVIHGFNFMDLFQLRLWQEVIRKPKYYGSKLKHTFIHLLKKYGNFSAR